MTLLEVVGDLQPREKKGHGLKHLEVVFWVFALLKSLEEIFGAFFRSQQVLMEQFTVCFLALSEFFWVSDLFPQMLHSGFAQNSDIHPFGPLQGFSPKMKK